MNKLLKLLKERWIVILQVGAFLAGIVTLVVTPPPVDAVSINTIRFSVSIVTAFMLIPVARFKSRQQFKGWFIASLVTFVCMVSVLIAYSVQYSHHVLTYYDGTKIVVGQEFSPEAQLKVTKFEAEDKANYHDGSTENKLRLLGYVGGHAERIWNFEEIEQNKFWLTFLFYVSISFITILLVCIFQTLELAFAKK